jgi:hypothetical protein
MTDYQLYYKDLLARYDAMKAIVAEQYTNGYWSSFNLPIEFKDKEIWEEELQFIEREIARKEYRALFPRTYYDSKLGKTIAYWYDCLRWYHD